MSDKPLTCDNCQKHIADDEFVNPVRFARWSALFCDTCMRNAEPGSYAHQVWQAQLLTGEPPE